MAEHHHLHQHVEVSDDGRTVAAAEVIISEEGLSQGLLGLHGAGNARSRAVSGG